MLLGSMAQNAFAQKIEIKGTVRDASDKSIEYVLTSSMRHPN